MYAFNGSLVAKATSVIFCLSLKTDAPTKGRSIKKETPA